MQCTLFYCKSSICITAIECPPLLDIPNGTISYSPDVSPNFDLGTNATYTCDDGFYIMDVTEARVCMDENAMGVWSGQKPLCVGTLLHTLNIPR